MVIVILIMTLLTLIVIALARNANREQRQSLDRQLNSQAFYAAESGVNDARDYVLKTSGAAAEKTDCGSTPGAAADEYFKDIPKSLNQEGVNYSCVLYDKDPTQLQYSNISTSTSKLIKLEDKNGSSISSITLKWHQSEGGDDFSGCPGAGSAGQFPQNYPENCDAGLLRISLLPTSGSDRQNLIDNMFLTFATPSKASGASGTVSYPSASGSPSAQGRAVHGICNDGDCQLTINNINKTSLYLHLRSLYRNNFVSLTGKDASGGDVEFKNAQMMVDSTGKAQDVLKRIRVFLPLSNSSQPRPEFVLQTAGALCKRLSVTPSNVDDLCSY